jgi:hypothetical protein
MEGRGLVEVTDLTPSRLTVKVDEEVSMTMTVVSHFPRPVTCTTLQLGLTHSAAPSPEMVRPLNKPELVLGTVMTE